MARSKGNIATTGVSGQVGQFVFKQYWGRTIISKVPDMSKVKRTDKQKQGNNLFREAHRWANALLRDPEVKERYRAMAKPGQNAHNVAISEYLRKKKEE